MRRQAAEDGCMEQGGVERETTASVQNGTKRYGAVQSGTDRHKAVQKAAPFLARYLAPDIWYKASPSIWYHISGSKYLVPDIWCQISGFQNVRMRGGEKPV